MATINTTAKKRHYLRYNSSQTKWELIHFYTEWGAILDAPTLSISNNTVTIGSNSVSVPKTGFTTDGASRNYAVQTSDGKMYVNVPWTDNNTTYGVATDSSLGLIKAAAVRDSAITTTQGGTTANRYYGVELDSSGKAFVNVPWTITSLDNAKGKKDWTALVTVNNEGWYRLCKLRARIHSSYLLNIEEYGTFLISAQNKLASSEDYCSIVALSTSKISNSYKLKVTVCKEDANGSLDVYIDLYTNFARGDHGTAAVACSIVDLTYEENSTNPSYSSYNTYYTTVTQAEIPVTGILNSDTIEVTSDGSIVTNQKIHANEFIENGTSLSNKYASKSHTHSDYLTSSAAINAYVSYSAEQSLTENQMERARSNIGAGTSNFFGYSANNKLSASLVNGLATVATSGSYNDLDNKPTIPTKASWNYDDVYVKYTGEQSLNETQMARARENIGAGTSSLTLGTTSSTAAYGNHNHDNVYLAKTSKGANNGVAELDANGKVPSSQLPSYVDDVINGYFKTADSKFYEDKEGTTYANAITGETGKIYIDLDTNKTYRWSGSAFVEISPSLALGTTSSTAFRGDWGSSAYAHAVTNKGSAFASGLYKITTNSEGHVTAATAVAKSDITNLGIPDNDDLSALGDDLSAFQDDVADTYLPLTGGTLNNSNNNTDTPLTIRGTTSSWIKFENSSGAALGWIGVSSSKQPSFYDINGNANRLAYYSDIPTNNNQLTNGAGYITSSGSCSYATSSGYLNRRIVLSSEAANSVGWYKIASTTFSTWLQCKATFIVHNAYGRNYGDSICSISLSYDSSGLNTSSKILEVLSGLNISSKLAYVKDSSNNISFYFYKERYEHPILVLLDTDEISWESGSLSNDKVVSITPTGYATYSLTLGRGGSSSADSSTDAIFRINGGVTKQSNYGKYFEYGVESSSWCYLVSNTNFYMSPSLYIAGGIYPYSTNTYKLGLSDQQWDEIYSKTIYENGTALSSKYLPLTGGTLTGLLELKSGMRYLDSNGHEIGSISTQQDSSRSNYYYPHYQYSDLVSDYIALRSDLPTNVAAANGGTAVSLVTTGDKYNWNNNMLPKSGGNMTGHIYMTGAVANSSISNTSQIVFGTSSSNHVAISSNTEAVIINPSTSSTTGQIILQVGSSPYISVNGTAVSLNGHTHSYLPLTGGTVSGTLVLSKIQDTSGVANNSPALIVGGTVVDPHIEMDANEICAKTDQTHTAALYLNYDGGDVYFSGNKAYASGNYLYSNNTKVSVEGHSHNYIPTSSKGAASGVAELDANGKVPSSQLPSYVDDVLEYAATSDFPATGESGKIYVATSTNLTYRWTGSAYTEISPSLALGETSSTAYRGDRGATAYSHASESGDVLGSTVSEGLYKISMDKYGHVVDYNSVQKSDITSLITNTYLPLSGGTLNNNTDTPLTIRGTTSSWIKYENSSATALGWIGVNSNKKPVFYDSTSHELALKENVLPLTGGTLYSTDYNVLTIKRNNSSYGAYIDFKNKNQDTNYWTVGMNADDKFSIGWKGDSTNTFIIDSSGNVAVKSVMVATKATMQYNTSEDCIDFVFA